jgi:hypothetical protein
VKDRLAPVGDDEALASLRASAMSHPDVTEGVACEGTEIESRTLKVGRSAFLFLRAHEGRLKLDTSLEEAQRLQSQEPGRYVVGSKGWVKFAWSDERGPDTRLLERWIAESYRLLSRAGRPGGAGPRSRA